MKIMQIVSTAVLLLALGSSQTLRAEGFSLEDLNPFSNGEKERETTRSHARPLVDVSSRKGGQSPSILDRVGNDLRRLNNGTKRFFANTADALCWKKSSPSSSRSRTASRTWRSPSTQKKSDSGWFTPFWSRQEPPLPQSPQDFVGMERPSM